MTYNKSSFGCLSWTKQLDVVNSDAFSSVDMYNVIIFAMTDAIDIWMSTSAAIS